MRAGRSPARCATGAGCSAPRDRGTLFLDEIGEMRPIAGGAAARAPDGEYRPVGSDQAFHADVRVVAATKRTLDEEVREGRFARTFSSG